MPTLISESLKSLRLLHQIVLLVSLAMIVFALTPDVSQDCKEAINELLALHEIEASSGEYTPFVRERFKDSEPRDTAYLVQVVQEAGAPTYGSPGFIEPFVLDHAQLLGPISSEEAFFVESHSFAWIKFVRDPRFMVDQLKMWIATQPRAMSLSEVRLGEDVPSIGSYGLRVLEQRNLPASSTMHVSFTFVDPSLPSHPQSGTSVPVRYELEWQASGPYAMDWLRSKTIGQRVIDQKTGILFPHLKKFWNSVASMGSGDAANFMQQKLDSLKNGTVSFFGIAVETSLAVVVGPSVCFVLLLALALHFKQFRSLPDFEGTAKYYPWIPLFASWPSRFVTFISLLIVPNLADACLLYRHGALDEWSSRVGVAASILTFAASIWVWVEIGVYRKSATETVGI